MKYSFCRVNRFREMFSMRYVFRYAIFFSRECFAICYFVTKLISFFCKANVFILTIKIKKSLTWWCYHLLRQNVLNNNVINNVIKLLLSKKQNAKYKSDCQNANSFLSKYFDFNSMWKFIVTENFVVFFNSFFD